MMDIWKLAIICVYIEKLQLFMVDSVEQIKLCLNIFKTQNMPIGDILTLHLYIYHFKNNDRYLEISNNMYFL